MKKLTLSNIDDIVRNGDSILLSPFPDNAKLFVLQENINIVLSDGSELVVYKGFVYDGASVPWLFEPLFPKWGIYSIGAFIHDILYYSKQTSRSFADTEYKRWMEATKVKEVQVIPRYLMVILFGWIVWYKGKYYPSEILNHNNKYIQWIKKI